MSRVAKHTVQLPRNIYSPNERSAKGSRKVTKTRKQGPRTAYSSRYPELVSYNVEIKQRAVFDWYENNEYDADTIFSSEWQCRLTNWREEFHGDISKKTLHDVVASYETRPKKLQLGAFFLAHPVPAFSLWNILQSCYELDDIICGNSMEKREEIATWQNLRPFEYLLSDKIISNWQMELTSFSSETKNNTSRCKQEASFMRLQAMLEGVQKLEETQTVLEQTFCNESDNLRCSYWMLACIQSSVDTRCNFIEAALQI